MEGATEIGILLAMERWYARERVRFDRGTWCFSEEGGGSQAGKERAVRGEASVGSWCLPYTVRSERIGFIFVWMYYDTIRYENDMNMDAILMALELCDSR